MAETVFFRLLASDDKAADLADATAALRDGRPTNPVVHVVEPASFRQVPGSPFAYWVSESEGCLPNCRRSRAAGEL